MSTDTASAVKTTADYAAAARSLFEVEHLSLVPLVGAVGAIATGIEGAWTLATVLFGVAYLFVFVQSRRKRC